MNRSSLGIKYIALSGTNVGNGEGVFKNINPSNVINFKTLVAGNNVSLTSNGNEIEISATGSGGTSSTGTTITQFPMGVSSSEVITTGEKGAYIIGYSGIITGWTMITDQSTSMVLDVWKANNSIPTVANSIFGTKPALSSSRINSVTGLNIPVSANDVFILNVDSNNSANYVRLDFQIIQ